MPHVPRPHPYSGTRQAPSKLWARIEFRGVTEDGMLRHPSLLRIDRASHRHQAHGCAAHNLGRAKALARIDRGRDWNTPRKMHDAHDMASSMITLTKIRELNLPEVAGGPVHLSAASGLVCLHSFIYVVADDELHLGVFGKADREPGHLIRLFDGALSDSKPDRKKQKPDLEALTLLPAYGEYRHGALLALGSGSKLNRRMGALLRLDARGAVHGVPRVVDLSPIFAALDDEFAAVNIEGAVVSGDELRLFQRGNKRHTESAIIRFKLSALLDALISGQSGAINPHAINPFDLGQVEGIPLHFTDAAALPDGDMVFTAIAEDTDDSYNDGPCVGAAVGVAGDDGTLRRLHRLDRPYKVEGVDARVDGDAVRLLVVTDADDAAIPASLLSATMGR
jgi:hypothetical protein